MRAVVDDADVDTRGMIWKRRVIERYKTYLIQCIAKRYFKSRIIVMNRRKKM